MNAYDALDLSQLDDTQVRALVGELIARSARCQILTPRFLFL